MLNNGLIFDTTASTSAMLSRYNFLITDVYKSNKLFRYKCKDPGSDALLAFQANGRMIWCYVDACFGAKMLIYNHSL